MRVYLSGSWINRNGTSYHPLDPKPGALAAEQKKFQQQQRDRDLYSDEQHHKAD
jgi:hypothetical protein